MEIDASIFVDMDADIQQNLLLLDLDNPFWPLDSLLPANSEIKTILERNNGTKNPSFPISSKSASALQLREESTQWIEDMTKHTKKEEEAGEDNFYQLNGGFPQNSNLRKFRQCLLKNLISEEQAKEIYDYLKSLPRDSSAKRRRNWRKEETQLLFFAIDKYSHKVGKSHNQFTKKDWEGVSKLIPGRSIDQCVYKWSMLREPKNKKGIWTKEENELLQKLVGEEEKPRWNRIANTFNCMVPLDRKRTSKQCRERWVNNVDSHIDRSQWKIEEDFHIIATVESYGKKWAQMKRNLAGRTELGIKNRYFTLLRTFKKQNQKNGQLQITNVVFEAALDQNGESTLEAEERYICQSLLQSMKNFLQLNGHQLQTSSIAPSQNCKADTLNSQSIASAGTFGLAQSTGVSDLNTALDSQMSDSGDFNYQLTDIQLFCHDEEEL